MAGLAGFLALGQTGAAPAEPVPVNVRSAPGQFDVAAVDSAVAHAIAAAAADVWRELAAPLGLPAGFNTPVFVSVVAAPLAGDAAFDASVEPGGVVSVRIPSRGLTVRSMRQALCRGLLLRLAVAQHGAGAVPAVPSWLETAACLAVETRVAPAQLDGLRQTMDNMPPPVLFEVLHAPAGNQTGRGADAGPWALWMFLQAESGRTGEWAEFLRLVLGGMKGIEALAAAYPGRYRTVVERELWWQTGWHHVRRARGLPALGTDDSRAEVAALARFVFAPNDADTVTPLDVVLAHAADASVAAELNRRASALRQLAPGLHPFYRNAALSLADVYEHARLPASRRAALLAAYERDWADATELQRAARAALDRLERSLAAP